MPKAKDGCTGEQATALSELAPLGSEYGQTHVTLFKSYALDLHQLRKDWTLGLSVCITSAAAPP